MALYRSIQCSFWLDPFIIDLSPDEKLFYLYCFTNEHLKQTGCFQFSWKIITAELGFSVEVIQSLIERFTANYKKIYYDKSTNEIFCLNWFKYNPCSSPNVLKCVQKEFDLIKSVEIKSIVENLLKTLEEAPTKPLGSPLQAPTKPLTSPLVVREEKRREEEEKKKENKIREVTPSEKLTLNNLSSQFVIPSSVLEKAFNYYSLEDITKACKEFIEKHKKYTHQENLFLAFCDRKFQDREKHLRTKHQYLDSS